LWIERGELRPLVPDQPNDHSTFEVVARRRAPKIDTVEAFLEDLRRESRDPAVAVSKTHGTEDGAAADASAG
jgi:hypothetical protein